MQGSFKDLRRGRGSRKGAGRGVVGRGGRVVGEERRAFLLYLDSLLRRLTSEFLFRLTFFKISS